MNLNMIIAIIYIFRFKNNTQNLGNYIKEYNMNHNESKLFRYNKFDNQQIESHKLLAKWNFI